MTKDQFKEAARIMAAIEGLNIDLCSLIDEVQGEFDERSERWQESEKGEEESERLEALDSAYNDSDAAVQSINNVVNP